MISSTTRSFRSRFVGFPPQIQRLARRNFKDNSKAGKTALKIHRAAEPYFRERAVYERLRDAGVSEVLGFNVPQLIRFDDELRVIEMSIVARPFVLDFAGAWLDTPPDFPGETWAE